MEGPNRKKTHHVGFLLKFSFWYLLNSSKPYAIWWIPMGWAWSSQLATFCHPGETDFQCLWRFPKSWGYPQIIYFIFGCSIITHPIIQLLGNFHYKPIQLWQEKESKSSTLIHLMIFHDKPSMFDHIWGTPHFAGTPHIMISGSEVWRLLRCSGDPPLLRPLMVGKAGEAYEVFRKTWEKHGTMHGKLWLITGNHLM